MYYMYIHRIILSCFFIYAYFLAKPHNIIKFTNNIQLQKFLLYNYMYKIIDQIFYLEFKYLELMKILSKF